MDSLTFRLDIFIVSFSASNFHGMGRLQPDTSHSSGSFCLNLKKTVVQDSV